IDVQVVGAIGNEDQTYAVAQNIAAKMKKIPGAVDIHMAQVMNVPQLRIDIDRTVAGIAGLTERDLTHRPLLSPAWSGQVTPSSWLDKRGVQYLVAVQTPQYKMSSIDAVDTTPLSTGPDATPALLGNVAQMSRAVGPANITHYNVARTFDVQANVA